ncbi:phosphatidate cytidylyltransferase [Ignisphaera aggregans DSM 17230]|uniref:Phosphatidate cytidylyltransferase n=1 Tax=Ignisphaera aggregans (strain DSM 17230 / JCM 13409 / AQ1.S1) TaxID=583356 RepID=E0SRD4_IGNAA|nr:phosphatidate cytidylyltransferase [Ignisphaera aggregans DSM 17230]
MNIVNLINIENIIHDTIIAILLLIYIMFIVLLLTKKLYNFMTSRNIKHNVAVYYNRKIIHMSAGGIVSLLIPLFFKEPLVPMIFALIIALIIYLPHKMKRILYWFQVEENIYEVNFCIAWGISIAILWILLGDPYWAVIPALMISFGDAVTGIIRNIVFGYRTKHWIGNIGMAIVTIPIGYIYAGLAGIVSAVLSTIIERIELNPIDDNILITLVSTVTLALFRII